MKKHGSRWVPITSICLGAVVVAAIPAAGEDRTMNEEIATLAAEIEPQLNFFSGLFIVMSSI